MAVIKCKMCGGDLNFADGASVAECEYCGSKQTIPNQDSEKNSPCSLGRTVCGRPARTLTPSPDGSTGTRPRPLRISAKVYWKSPAKRNPTTSSSATKRQTRAEVVPSTVLSPKMCMMP